ncbi:MAG: MMPL family transporter [Jatrophihabitantaceae bacterium]
MSRTALVDDEPDATGGRRRRWSRGVYLVAGLAVLWFLIGASGGPYQGKLSEVQKNDNSAYLPGSAESTKVSNEVGKFTPVETVPGFIVYERAGGLTAADKAKIASDRAKFLTVAGVAADQVGAPVFSQREPAAYVSAPLIAKDNGKEVDGKKLADVEKAVVKIAQTDVPAGLTVRPAGPGGLIVAFIDSFNGIDGSLLLAAGLVVIVILLVVYRSPVLWFFPLFSAVLALGAAALIIYPLAKHNVITLNGQSQGILSVLVIGAGTDYALLLVSRYREELHTHASRVEAMTRAWRGAAPAIGASAITVIIGLMCLTLGELNSDKSLGPVCAIGIACTVGVMLTFLPAFLVLFGRWVFWPRVPHVDNQADIATHGAWGRFAGAIGRHPRRSWLITAVFLLICVAGITTLKTDGLTVTESFTSKPDAVKGQATFDKAFDNGAGAPAQIIASAGKADQVIAAAKTVPGIDTTDGGVCIATDYAKVAKLIKGNGGKIPPGAQTSGCAPPIAQVSPVGGKILIDANLTSRYDTAQAADAVVALRKTVHAIAGAQAKVGGQTAATYDVQAASRHDRNLIIPIVLIVILLVLGLVLRAILAPVLLILTVVLSFSAALGVSAVVFNHVFHFANADPAFPLFAFVFLVALGIDYNIFLMTRVREETLKHGTRTGILRGLSVTGGVITSAGVVLAATFIVLGVLPLVFLAELGFAVAFGVLLDTILVRSVLVPALSHDIGRRIWWPSKLAHAGE